MGAVKQVYIEFAEILRQRGENAALQYLRKLGVPLIEALQWLKTAKGEKNV